MSEKAIFIIEIDMKSSKPYNIERYWVRKFLNGKKEKNWEMK